MNKICTVMATLAAFAAGIGVLPRPAAAQGGGLLPIRIKVGVWLPQDGDAKRTAGNTLVNGEVEVALPTLGPGRTLVTAGYAEGSKSGNKLRVIPITIARTFSPPNPVSGVTGNVYAGLGAGAYFIRVSGSSSANKTQIGGFAVVGYQTPSALFVEAKYHVTGKVAGVSPNGLAILIGSRF